MKKVSLIYHEKRKAILIQTNQKNKSPLIYHEIQRAKNSPLTKNFLKKFFHGFQSSMEEDEKTPSYIRSLWSRFEYRPIKIFSERQIWVVCRFTATTPLLLCSLERCQDRVVFFRLRPVREKISTLLLTRQASKKSSSHIP